MTILYESEESTTCEWFARCTNLTHTAVSHPILDIVPICERCAEKAEILLS
jgi:hypothetical protein